MSKTIVDPKAFGKVAVLMGGAAQEREVSLKSGKAVLEALQRQGVDATGFDVGRNMIAPLLERPGLYDRVFNILHGRGGEDGVLQGCLDTLGIPFTGSGVLASALSMDKLRTKLCWLGAGLPTPSWMLIRSREDLKVCIETLGFPVIIKPAQEGSSIGMSRADDPDQLAEAWQSASIYDCEVFAESWIAGKEYTVAMLDNVPLPLIRLETPHAFYDFDAKYRAETTRSHCPCGRSAAEEHRFQQLAKTACEIVGVSGWARVDLMVDELGQAWLIEVNTVPGMTDHSLVPMAAREAGIDFDALVWRILATTLRQEA